MKRYGVLTSIILVALITTGCTSSKSVSKTVSTVSTTNANVKNVDSQKNAEEESENLGKLFKENNALKKPNIDEARDFKLSLSNGSVIMLSKESSSELEVYNISSLDKFIDSFNNGKAGYVRVIKGTLKNDGPLLVNKLEEYESDGKIIKDLAYDTYSNKDKFLPGTPTYCAKMVKEASGDGIRYSILLSKDTPDNMGATVISFDKSSIKN
ncbi:DUF4362 domain-containing protein [Clostridium manihotivorum]|uniref:Lipoprotein n=1 Tax=Clostridium manihotivorum TaxID=2320868 RepID=A0A410DUV7_9CLOT|nr:DUF4362 domain-containing protein [Clostridium manihotivorum]QAA32924.1 hypothetical protein C1I91_15460 [Clostridium manihotivorum]